MKPVNWISATGRKPCAASPTESPAMAFSASGVSSTRSGPKRCKRPSVARNTPPSAATSSPRTRTSQSSAMARASAILTAWTRLISDIAISLPLAGECGSALLGEILGHRVVGEVEDRLRALGRDRQIGLHCLIDRSCYLGEQSFLVGFGPNPAADEIVSQPRDRIFGPMRAHIGIAAVAARIIGGSVVAQPIGQRLDQRWPAAGLRLDNGTAHRLTHRDDVVAVDLLALDAGGDSLLREGLRGGLLGERERDRPAVVVDDEDQRQTPHSGDVERLGNIALRGGAVPKGTDRDSFFAPELECQSDADRVRRVGPDRHANRE